MQSLPLWLFLCVALLLMMLAWWQAPRIRPQLAGFRTSKKQKNQTKNTAKYWTWRLLSLLLFMAVGLVIDSIIWQQITRVNTTDAEGNAITESIPLSYALKQRWWQLGMAPLPTMVTIPAGTFMMGSKESDSEKPIHEVTIPQAFQMSQHEITFEQYDYFIGQMHDAGLNNQSGESPVDYEYPNDEGWGRGQKPVINVSWDDTQSYVNWLSQVTNQHCRLPSEAEWEYAARAGTITRYPWSNDASHEQANYGSDECCEGAANGKDEWVNSAPVGSFPANPFDLHDMHGNVYEWVQDTWHYNYEKAPKNGDAWVGGDEIRVLRVSENRVLRGGSWSRTPNYLRSASRSFSSPVNRIYDFGFRVVCFPLSVR